MFSVYFSRSLLETKVVLLDLGSLKGMWKEEFTHYYFQHFGSFVEHTIKYKLKKQRMTEKTEWGHRNKK